MRNSLDLESILESGGAVGAGDPIDGLLTSNDGTDGQRPGRGALTWVVAGAILVLLCGTIVTYVRVDVVSD